MLPDGWKETALQSISTKSISYGIVQTGNSEVGTIPCFRVVDLTKKYIKKEEMIKTTEDISNSYRRTILAEGDILFALRGEIAKAFLVTKEFVGLNITRGIARISPSKEVLPNFLFFALQSPYYKKKCIQHVGGSALQEISITELRKSTILLPPLPEQEKIAAVLSTWDKAISTADALLENSRQQKKALMQQLLTGKRRLPGFKGEWEQVKLKKIGTTYAGLTGKSKEDFGQGSLFIPYLNVFKNSFVDNTNFEKVTIYDNEKQNSVKYGDILFTISSETPHEVGMSSVFLDHIENIYLNSFCFGFRMKNFSTLLPQYARFLFRGNNFRGNIASLAQGATRYNLSKTQFLEIAVLLPPLDEQRAIAAVLDAADREIALLEQKAARLREEKKALMQQLLTGKRRVRV